ncbi:MAG: hypothetical protein A2Y71_04165 [Bacteroidetes bacterium RBG_13_42_15]|nr:MAG: hypothetical protein A2Y71_04165 [Bacteroidetes bacterium RBG_13_42_15]
MVKAGKDVVRLREGEFGQAIQNMKYLKPDALITSELRMSHAQKAFELLEKDPANQLKIILTV